MRVIVYKCKDGFDGTLNIELPSRRNRLGVFKKHMAGISEGKDTEAGLSLYDELYSMADKCVKNVKVSHKESGGKYKSFSQMSNDSLCDDICEDVIKVLMDGEKVGEE